MNINGITFFSSFSRSLLNNILHGISFHSIYLLFVYGAHVISFISIAFWIWCEHWWYNMCQSTLKVNADLFAKHKKLSKYFLYSNIVYYVVEFVFLFSFCCITGTLCRHLEVVQHVGAHFQGQSCFFLKKILLNHIFSSWNELLICRC